MKYVLVLVLVLSAGPLVLFSVAGLIGGVLSVGPIGPILALPGIVAAFASLRMSMPQPKVTTRAQVDAARVATEMAR
jgi:hypothetical protein